MFLSLMTKSIRTQPVSHFLIAYNIKPHFNSQIDEEMTEETPANRMSTGPHHPNISQWIANAIADTGCRVVYGGHGGALVPLVNAVCAHPDLTWVCARNEHDAATMAAAHAKLTGGLGVVIATSGPGATNLTTGLMEAYMDRVSLLAITGMKPTAQLGYAEFQDVNQSRIFAGAGIEWSKDATSPDGVSAKKSYLFAWPLLCDSRAFVD
jgi:2-succinyl-5-enolpyruvyl-6-hydroxy-3-cyclohexene-1-carboxylate synthase